MEQDQVAPMRIAREQRITAVDGPAPGVILQKEPREAPRNLRGHLPSIGNRSAGSGDVLRMVLSYGGMLMAVGVPIGVPMALGAGKLLASQLFETPSSDPITYAAVSVALLVTGLAACAVPAFRATGVDPMAALRND